jgi:hypothetical protein
VAENVKVATTQSVMSAMSSTRKVSREAAVEKSEMGGVEDEGWSAMSVTMNFLSRQLLRS